MKTSLWFLIDVVQDSYTKANPQDCSDIDKHDSLSTNGGRFRNHGWQKKNFEAELPLADICTWKIK